MLTWIKNQAGDTLNAKIEIEPSAIILHSRGGAFGKPNLRNPDYVKALRLIFERLDKSDFGVSGVWIDSAPARKLRANKRFLLSASECRKSFEDVIALIQKRGAAFGRAASSTGHGNSTKRIKIGVQGRSVGELKGILNASEHFSPGPINGSRPPIIYFNIGWMKHYMGPDADDPTIGAHGYLDEHEHGAECYNFYAEGGSVRGYRPPGKSEKTDISRLGADSNDSEIGGVLVIWIAREPHSKKTMIVGWYEDATVFREAKPSSGELNGEKHHYSVEADAKKAVLIPPAAREFVVQSSRTKPGQGFGQKPTWYGSDEVDAYVWKYVKSWGPNSTKKTATKSKAKKPPKNHDPELRRKVERAAVDHAIEYLKARHGKNCEIKSVEALAKGWDLEARIPEGRVLMEVKGLLNDSLVCELTPNEYTKMMSHEFRDDYVIYVLNNALAEKPAFPVATVFRHVGDFKWKSADGRNLVVDKRIGAVLTCE